MNFKTFLLGLFASFGLPWLLAIAIPFGVMNDLEPVAYEEEADGQVGFYTPGRTGEVAQGSSIYGAEGCYYCHTQLIRTTDAGRDLWRADWAGIRHNDPTKDTRRATTPFDYEGEEVAHVGLARVGPDLSNFGRRLEDRLAKDESDLSPREWVYLHLFNPRAVPGSNDNSACPSKTSLFEQKEANLILGGALPLPVSDGKVWVPNSRGKILASYLLSLKKDTLNNPLPAALDRRIETSESAN